jgi:CRP-like cAMP-binding protein
LEKGRVILKEGHPASGFYFLLSGSVGIYQKRDGGEPELINTVEEGQSFGVRMFLGLIAMNRIVPGNSKGDNEGRCMHSAYHNKSVWGALLEVSGT